MFKSTISAIRIGNRKWFAGAFLLFTLLLSGSGGVSAKNGINSVYLPLVMHKYETWSTNFANVTDLAAAGISAYGASVAIDTTNVNSGGKSIKVYGTIGSRDSCLNLAFGFWGLTGQDSVDLSEKILNLEVYLPADSPIIGFYIQVYSGGKFVVVRNVHANMYKGQWHTYKVDIREDITLKPWRTWSSLTSPGLTDAQAVDILKNAQTIAIVGMIYKDHTPAQSYFLVDRLGWESAGPAPAYNPSLESLQQYAPASLPIGGVMEPDGAYDPEYMRNFVQQFNATQAWGQFPVTEPAGDVFTYDQSWSPMPYADYFNETQGFPLIRYSGIGENPLWIPDWLPGKSYAQAQTILENFTRALVDHYKGKTAIWILFNEILRYDLQEVPSTGFGLKDRNQSPQTWTDNYSPWSANSSDVIMIEDAFRVARAADPGALLIINQETGFAEGQASGEALYKLVTKMKSDDVPIDGVGFEGHFIVDQSGNFPGLVFDPVYGFTDIAANVERYAALGLKVAFTEVDVSIYLADIDPSTPAGQALLAQRRELQAAAYRSLLHIALTHPNVVFFNLWDWADEYSWSDPEWAYIPMAGFGNDLGLFDLSYQKKPSYYAMLDELKAPSVLPLPGTFDKTGPLEAATDQAVNPTLTWAASSGATGYQYCIDTSPNKKCDTAWVSTGASTSASVDGLLPLTTYSWQVRATNASGVTHANIATWGSFTTQADWSTNFAGLTDPAAAWIFGSPGLITLDTFVHSGGQSIKISPDPAMDQSWMILNFGMPGLINHATFDLSEKILSYEIYLPVASPLDSLAFKIIDDDDQVLQIYSVNGDLHKGQWYTYSIDLSGLTDAQALDVLKHARQLVIVAMVSTGNIPAGSYFLVDRLGWEASAP
jgi:endo-1,4-beta-xylanase